MHCKIGGDVIERLARTDPALLLVRIAAKPVTLAVLALVKAGSQEDASERRRVGLVLEIRIRWRSDGRMRQRRACIGYR